MNMFAMVKCLCCGRSWDLIKDARCRCGCREIVESIDAGKGTEKEQRERHKPFCKVTIEKEKEE